MAKTLPANAPTKCLQCGGKIVAREPAHPRDNNAYECEGYPETCGWYVVQEAQDLLDHMADYKEEPAIAKLTAWDLQMIFFVIDQDSDVETPEALEALRKRIASDCET